ncbi:hypothetical protein GCM10028806_23470 [Spirosoma terrae]
MISPDKSIQIKLKALLAAWITIIFGTSALFTLTNPITFKTYSNNVFLNFFISTWEIADEIGPIVKISIIIIFAILVSISTNVIKYPQNSIYLVNAVLAILSVVIVLGLLPKAYSRGFGIGLTGIRFDHQTLPIYLIGSALGGLVYSYSLKRQNRKLTHI